jgi:hypothetical protein
VQVTLRFGAEARSLFPTELSAIYVLSAIQVYAVWRIAFVGNQHRVALQHVHELVMLQMGMAQRGYGAGVQPGQIHAKVRKPEQVAQWPFLVANDS